MNTYVADELLDIVDEKGTTLRTAIKPEAHRDGLLHKTVIACLKYKGRWGLVVQASDRQDAGQLVAPVGGHVSSGESEIEALKREAKEEIGVENFKYHHLGTARFHREVIGRNENHLMFVYIIKTDDNIVLGPEGESMEYFTDDEFRQILIDQPRRIGDAHWFLLENFLPDYLPAGYVNKWTKRD